MLYNLLGETHFSSTLSAPAAMLSWAKGTCMGSAWHCSGLCGSDGQALTVPSTNKNEQADWTKKKKKWGGKDFPKTIWKGKVWIIVRTPFPFWQDAVLWFAHEGGVQVKEAPSGAPFAAQRPHQMLLASNVWNQAPHTQIQCNTFKIHLSGVDTQ